MMNAPVTVQMPEKPIYIELGADYDASARLMLTVFGKKISVDMRSGEIWIEKTRIPLSLKKEKLDVRLVIDRCTAEIYADGGRYLMAENFVCDYNLPYIKLEAVNGSPEIEKIKIYSLS